MWSYITNNLASPRSCINNLFINSTSIILGVFILEKSLFKAIYTIALSNIIYDIICLLLTAYDKFCLKTTTVSAHNPLREINSTLNIVRIGNLYDFMLLSNTKYYQVFCEGKHISPYMYDLDFTVSFARYVEDRYETKEELVHDLWINTPNLYKEFIEATNVD